MTPVEADTPTEGSYAQTTMNKNEAGTRVRAALTGLMLATLIAACTDGRKERTEGARRALAAQPDIEIVGTDDRKGQVTVRSRTTGQVAVIDVAAASATAKPAWDVAAGSSAPPGATSAADSVAPPSPATATASAEPPMEPPASPDARPASPGAARAPLVTRDSTGRIARLEGPGFSVTRLPGTPGASAKATDAAAVNDAPADSQRGAQRRRVERSIVCGPNQRLTIEDTDIEVTGAGIVAERGCDLRIANSRVVAGGWGLVINPGATVRIDASLIEGRTGSLDAYAGGTLSAWGSTFKGASSRPMTASADFIDRGGNVWTAR